jgi:hypothetical protein
MPHLEPVEVPGVPPGDEKGAIQTDIQVQLFCNALKQQ